MMSEPGEQKKPGSGSNKWLSQKDSLLSSQNYWMIMEIEMYISSEIDFALSDFIE